LTLWDRQEVPFNFFAKTHPIFLKIFNIKNQSVTLKIIWLSNLKIFHNFEWYISSIAGGLDEDVELK